MASNSISSGGSTEFRPGHRDPYRGPKPAAEHLLSLFPPVTSADVNAGVKCDEGFATQITVLLQRKYPAWITYAAAVLMIAGISALAYGLFELGSWIVEVVSN